MTLLVSRESIALTNGKKPCSKCGRPRDRKGQRYCGECHAADMRARRAGMINMLVTPEEFNRIRQARIEAAFREQQAGR